MRSWKITITVDHYLIELDEVTLFVNTESISKEDMDEVKTCKISISTVIFYRLEKT